MSTGFLAHTLLICQFELKRLFATKKGLLYLTTFVLVWYFILFYPIRFSSELLGQEKNVVPGGSLLDFIGYGSLLKWQVPELGVYWQFSLILFPLLMVMSSADQTCSDRERGTLRFLSLRVSRDSLFFGRFAGVMLIHTLLITLSLLSTIFFALYRDANLFAVVFDEAAAIMLNLIMVLLPFGALMAALSATVKSARQATVWAVLIWSFMAGLVSLLASYLPILEVLKMLIPGYQVAALSQLAAWQALQLAYIPLLQAIVLLGVGSWIMRRRLL